MTGLVALPGGSGVDPVLTGALSVPDSEQEVVTSTRSPWPRDGLSDGHVRHARSLVIELTRT